MRINAFILTIASLLLLPMIPVLSEDAASDNAAKNETAAKKTEYKTIFWSERRQWVESIKPTPYWIDQKKHGYIDTKAGFPQIMVDDKPMPVLSSYAGYMHDPNYYAKVGREYHNTLCDTMTQGHIDYEALNVAIYVKNRKVEWGRARPAAKEFMQKNPDARFFLRLHFIVDNDWFSSEYPGNMTTFEDGTEDHWTDANGKKQRKYSYASNVWEKLAAEGLIALLNDLSKEPFADRVFGLQVTFGTSGEGGWWTNFKWGEHGIDYSPAMRDYFREYVRQKYKGDVGKLQAAWGRKVSFENISIPSLAARGFDEASSCNEGAYQVPGSFGYFRNPQKDDGQQVIDFNMAMCNVQAERLSYLCEVVKRASDGKLIAGGLHSPPFAATLFHWVGPGGFDGVIKSPYIDFDSTPWTYEGRALGEGLTFRGPAGSMGLHNKIFWIECDTRTSSVLQKSRKYGAPLNVNEDRDVLRRDFIRLITSEANGYWYEIEFPWFTEPEQREVIAEIGKMSGKLMKLDRHRNSEIAVIYDMDSIFYTSEFVDFNSLCRQMLQEFVYIGADFDMYTTDDIGNPAVDNHKLFIFPNAICLSDEKRLKIDKFLKKDGKVLVWSYAPGLINPDSNLQLSEKHCADLTGMKLEYLMDKMSPLMKITNQNDKMAKSLPAGYQFGAHPRPVSTGPGYALPEKPFIPDPIKVFPQFYVNDTHAEKLGEYLDSGKTGFAAKRIENWTSVYLGTYLMSSEVLRAAAKEAGVHLYVDSDNVVYHNQSLLGIHALTDGKKLVHLPRKCDVYDLFSNKLIGKSIDRFEVIYPKGKTSLYFTGNLADLEKTGIILGHP